MNIRTLENLNKTYENRTFKYLFPMYQHESSLLKVLGDYFIVGVGLWDKHKIDLYDDCLGVVIDTKDSKGEKSKKINLKHPLIKTHYPYGELIYGYLHMVVLKIPNQHKGIKERFINGEYSLLYKDPSKFFLKEWNNLHSRYNENALKVLTKDEEYKIELETKLGVELPENCELDSTPNLQNEVFI